MKATEFFKFVKPFVSVSWWKLNVVCQSMTHVENSCHILISTFTDWKYCIDIYGRFLCVEERH